MAYESAPKRGVVVHYGPRDLETKGGSHGSKGRIKTAAAKFDFADLNADYSVASDLVGVVGALPAGAHILSATVKVLEAFDGTTPTAAVGLRDASDVAIDDDGLLAATSVTATGTIAGAGALVGADITVDGYLVVVGSATDSTAGEMEVVIEYMI